MGKEGRHQTLHPDLEAVMLAAVWAGLTFSGEKVVICDTWLCSL